jgi:hypothetical protein
MTVYGRTMGVCSEHAVSDQVLRAALRYHRAVARALRPKGAWAAAWGAGLLAALCIFASAGSGQSSYSEDVVKAVLLERIVTFLSWSDSAAADAKVDMVVLGRGALGGEVERVYNHRKFAGRSVIVRYVDEPQAIGKAHIVIIGREHAKDLTAVLRECTREGVLTVGDTPGFGERGVAINFYRDGTRVRFEVAPSALKRARIQASYKLLTLARVVGGP